MQQTETQSIARQLGPKAPVARFLVDQLAAWNVDTIFGVAGDTILPLLDVLSRHQIRFVQLRHEETAAYAASAYAKVTGKLGVCLADAGPGTGHLINGLADAKLDQVPVLAITGQVESRYLGTEYKQYVDQQRLLGEVTIRSENLGAPASIILVLTGLMRAAIDQGGPVHLSIPQDFWQAAVPGQVCPPEPFLNQPPIAPEHVIDEAAQWLTSAARPMILMGRGSSFNVHQVLSLAERLGAGVVYTLPAAGVAWQHPLMVGGLGEAGSEAATRLLQECDTVIKVGATYWPPKLTSDRKRVLAIDQNRANVSKGIPADFGIVGEIGDVLHRVLNRLVVDPDATWRSQVEREINDWRTRIELEEAKASSRHPARAVEQLSREIPPEAVICLDVGDHVLWFDRGFRGRGQTILVSGRWRGMGFGLGASLAAALAYPGRPVYAIMGDGGFSMVLGDYVSAVELGLPITYVVFNNRAYAMEANRMTVAGFRLNGVGLRDIRFDQIARDCGGIGYRVIAQDLGAALAESYQSNLPVLIDLQVEPAMVPTTHYPKATPR